MSYHLLWQPPKCLHPPPYCPQNSGWWDRLEHFTYLFVYLRGSNILSKRWQDMYFFQTKRGSSMNHWQCNCLSLGWVWWWGTQQETKQGRSLAYSSSTPPIDCISKNTWKNPEFISPCKCIYCLLISAPLHLLICSLPVVLSVKG